MDIKLLKKEQRIEIKERWKSISTESKEAWDKEIFNSLFSLNELKAAKSVFVFVSMKNEPDTLNVIEELLKEGKKVLVPKCESKGIMKAVKISSLSDLKAGAYGILEPEDDSITESPQNIDFGIIPCVSADRSLNRLGHGGGYYDRFMEKGHFTKALLSYERLLLENAAVESHDVPCDYLITEEKIYKR